MGEGLEPVAEPPCSLGLLQRGDEVDEGAVVDPASGLDSCDGEADGQMGFPNAWQAPDTLLTNP
jgi:hypothetical protein